VKHLEIGTLQLLQRWSSAQAARPPLLAEHVRYGQSTASVSTREVSDSALLGRRDFAPATQSSIYQSKGTKMNRLHSIFAGLTLGASMIMSAHAAGYYALKSTSAAFLSPTGGVLTDVLSTPVDSGTWVIHSSSPAVNFGGTDITRCTLWVDGVQINQSSSMLGGGGGMPAAVEMSNLAVATVASGQVIALKCGHDANVAGQRIDPGAELVITRAPKK